MNTELATGILEEIIKQLGLYRSLLEEKRMALVAGKHDQLDIFVTREERIMLSLQQAEKKRFALAGNSRLSELMPDEPAQAREQMLRLEAEAKQLLAECGILIEHTQFLIRRMREFLHETISTLLLTKKRSIVDRKV